MNTLNKSLKGKKHVGIYFQSWCSNFVNNEYNIDLITVENFNVCYICYVHPLCNYQLKSYTFKDSGLDFIADFKTVRKNIELLKKKNILVILSVGGSEYSFRKTNYVNISNLCLDLGCDGIDICINQQTKKEYNLSEVINSMRKFLKNRFISVTIFNNSNMNNYIKVIKDNSFQLDWVIIIDLVRDEIFSLIDLYKNYFKGLIIPGFKIFDEKYLESISILKEHEEKIKNGFSTWILEEDNNLKYNNIIKNITDIIG
jgi:hypothetical protein